MLRRMATILAVYETVGYFRQRARIWVTYLITVACYVCHLHGDVSGRRRSGARFCGEGSHESAALSPGEKPRRAHEPCSHLNRPGLDGPVRKRWARHGSTRWLWKPENVSAAIRY